MSTMRKKEAERELVKKEKKKGYVEIYKVKIV